MEKKREAATIEGWLFPVSDLVGGTTRLCGWRGKFTGSSRYESGGVSYPKLEPCFADETFFRGRSEKHPLSSMISNWLN